MGLKKKKNASKEQRPAPVKREEKLKPYTPAKEATKDTDEVPEIQGGGLQSIENLKYREGVRKAAMDMLKKMPGIKFIKLKGSEEHYSSTDKDEQSKVISMQTFEDDGEGGDVYIGTAHATADGQFTFKEKKAKKYVKGSDM